ncbi:MAG: 16S rRNA (cytosine(1402)-N(4))-methyltransferase RsmH [gamma proteobacterium symbiont of Lucinoma myriamae]|nr:16S rRNA (cytosine(1402)-N(4))-methyltransferase RsmH [gamma proteobacterium symbiont of Lucinoma myriamae]MCU7818965.1 16S rRNA (cytosine(1402)-N(4))-methyltransferase RsmH [gamma proteobacterium symbiont of Lucinoma myriamae]MCU7833485.1 16S rRNA (cytosine(1402)-N(4))-methyltransferase RsmH [gamma proteobacterium symbiont of Lucinoma myriamae]
MSTEHYEHKPVLLNESIEALAIDPTGIYVDGTFGRGGHSQLIMDQLGDTGRLIAFDKDPQAIATAEEKFADDPRFSIHHGSFAELEEYLTAQGLCGKVNGILLDLGVSSPQLDDPQRGFSFQQSGPLDMRMNDQQGMSAAQWINKAKEVEIASVLYEYGEERYSRRIAKAIVLARENELLNDTKQLAEIVKAAHPRWEKKKHPATRSFQGIRIFINNELGDLDECLTQSYHCLAKSGLLAVISFHSLEDRKVKRFFKRMVEGEKLPLDLPVMEEEVNRKMKLEGKRIKAGKQELYENPRARSAVLRVAKKL